MSHPFPTQSVARPAAIGQYPSTDFVAALSVGLRLGRATVQQALKWSDPRSWFGRVRDVGLIAYESGHAARFEFLMQPIDALRRHRPVPALTPALWMDEAELDAREDEAQVAHLLDPKPSTWSTLRRLYVGYRRLMDDLIAAGDAKYGRSA